MEVKFEFDSDTLARLFVKWISGYSVSQRFDAYLELYGEKGKSVFTDLTVWGGEAKVEVTIIPF